MLIRVLAILLLGASLTAQEAKPSPMQQAQTALAAVRKAVQSAEASLAAAAPKEYQALLDAMAAQKAVEALIPVVAPPK